MKSNNFVKISAIIMMIFSCGIVNADIYQKLSKPIQIRLNDVTIAEALEKIGQKAGVTFVISDLAAWKLPYGKATRLSVVLNGPLADSMTEMLNAFFMRFAVGDKEITIYPRKELKHIPGRPSTKQLEILQAIYTRPIKLYSFDDAQLTIKINLKKDILVMPIDVQEQINDKLRQLVGEKPLYIWRGGYKKTSPSTAKMGKGIANYLTLPENKIVELNIPITLVQLLEQVGISGEGPKDTEWYISRTEFAESVPEIRVVPISEFNELNFNQIIDVSYQDESLSKIMQELVSRAEGNLIASGSNINEYEISVDMQNMTIEQAIRNVCHMTGVRYEIEADNGRVHIMGPTKTKGKSQSSGYAGKISVPMNDGEYFIEFMLREGDLTDKLKKLREEKFKEILGPKVKE